MKPDLTPIEVVRWLRKQSTRFAEMADQLESTFQLNGEASRALPSTTFRTSSGELAERISELLRDGVSRRVAQIASAVGAPEQIVRKLIGQVVETFALNERGWVSLKVLSNKEDAP